MLNSFYSQEELTEIGFKKVGNNVLISKKQAYIVLKNRNRKQCKNR